MSMADYIGILQNTTHTGPPRLRYVFRVVQTQTMHGRLLYWKIEASIRLRYFLQGGGSETNHCSFRPPRVKDLFQV
jgi:hypothetical protein